MNHDAKARRSVTVIPAVVWRAFVLFTARRLARRTCRYLRTIDAHELDTLAREAREFAGVMKALRARVHRCWRHVCNPRLADARH